MTHSIEKKIQHIHHVMAQMVDIVYKDIVYKAADVNMFIYVKEEMGIMNE